MCVILVGGCGGGWGGAGSEGVSHGVVCVLSVGRYDIGVAVCEPACGGVGGVAETLVGGWRVRDCGCVLVGVAEAWCEAGVTDLECAGGAGREGSHAAVTRVVNEIAMCVFFRAVVADCEGERRGVRGRAEAGVSVGALGCGWR